MGHGHDKVRFRGLREYTGEPMATRDDELMGIADFVFGKAPGAWVGADRLAGDPSFAEEADDLLVRCVVPPRVTQKTCRWLPKAAARYWKTIEGKYPRYVASCRGEVEYKGALVTDDAIEWLFQRINAESRTTAQQVNMLRKILIRYFLRRMDLRLHRGDGAIAYDECEIDDRVTAERYRLAAILAKPRFEGLGDFAWEHECYLDFTLECMPDAVRAGELKAKVASGRLPFNASQQGMLLYTMGTVAFNEFCEEHNFTDARDDFLD